MSSRDFAVVALGRFLVVERYRERCPSSPAEQLPGHGAARTGGHAGKQDPSSGPGAGSAARVGERSRGGPPGCSAPARGPPPPADEFPASGYARRHSGLRS